ncbi:MAG: RecQ family ATP-dependent DNA helicase [Chitinophagaceae bacterium]|nr:MAG: RecQ family ATP-dependent DNA helicase [Chitinophagaceae bacterium]
MWYWRSTREGSTSRRLFDLTDLHQILKENWGYDQYRPMQEDIIRSVLAGNDTLAILPTGGGKSICYQVPGLAMEGTCLVISPLIALMKDQVEGLRKRNITALSVYSGMSRKELINTLTVASESNCKFLFVSPERLETALFKEYLPGLHINLLAVDEAHCISQWGYDFRPPYLRIAALRSELPGVPVLALTASATPEVQEDIMDRLDEVVTDFSTIRESKPVKVKRRRTWKEFRQSFERANLSYSVFKVESRISKIMEILQKVPGTAIIYCRSRKRTQELSDLIRLRGLSCEFYHAGLSQDQRNTKQEDWIAGRTRVIVCTNAFGMGIDKPDVRVVIHADVPDCLENYYQEAGRAGRDGKKSYAVLLYGEPDLEELEESVDIRFPSADDIRKVYQSVANYLQLPAGLGEGAYYDFEMADFVSKFKLESRKTLYALKALEQEGWMSFNEQVFLPSVVQFNATKDYLYEYEQSHPQHDALIKTLLRAYAGIFDFPVFISEMQVAQLMRENVELVKKLLVQVAAARIIEYRPRKDTPQLLMIRNRQRTEELPLNMTAIRQRKEKYESRLKAMVEFVRDDSRCRSQVIGVYFGDKNIRECGVCDNCLRRKVKPVGTAEFNILREKINTVLKTGPVGIKQLVEQMQPVKKDRVMEVIRFLEAEQFIGINADGLVSAKG